MFFGFAYAIIFMFSYPENIAHFKGGISFFSSSMGVGGTPQRWGSNIKSGWNYNQGGAIQVNTVYNYWHKTNVINVSPSR